SYSEDFTKPSITCCTPSWKRCKTLFWRKKHRSSSGERRSDQTTLRQIPSVLNESVDLYATGFQIDEDPTAIFNNDAFVREWDALNQPILPDNTDNAVSSHGGAVVPDEELLLNDAEDVISFIDAVSDCTEDDANNQECVEETVIEADENLPSNQQNFSHDLLMELREQNRLADEKLDIISENVKRLCDCVHMVMTNSEEQGSLIRFILDRVGANREMLNKIEKILQDEFRESQLMVNILTNINNAVIEHIK
ncbi:uncharacterized protein LOC127641694, partial [Xyrauchen texanus]|uniref:uncharacterized protein LOC127641694 n=1 Tax=Xyrauchen texanus TaxID=154827 RepID=UPI002242C10D